MINSQNIVSYISDILSLSVTCRSITNQLVPCLIRSYTTSMKTSVIFSSLLRLPLSVIHTTHQNQRHLVSSYSLAMILLFSNYVMYIILGTPTKLQYIDKNDYTLYHARVPCAFCISADHITSTQYQLIFLHLCVFTASNILSQPQPHQLYLNNLNSLSPSVYILILQVLLSLFLNLLDFLDVT